MKRRFQSPSSLPSPKKLKGDNLTSGNKSQEGILVNHRKALTPNSNDNKSAILQLNSSLNHLLWIHEQLKQMHLKTSTDVMQVISDLCEGIQEIFDLSHLHITDIQFRRLFRITETLFVGAIQFHEPEEVGRSVIDIYDRMEHLFDSFLDHINYEKMNIDRKLRGYAFVSGLMLSTRDEQLRKIAVEKLVLRIASTVETMWSTCIFASYSGDSQLLEPDDIDSFYLYCDLLRIAVTSRNWEDKEWLKVSAFQSLLTVEKTASSLFVLLPNLAYVLYSTIVASSHYSCKDFCDLSLQNAPIQDVQIAD